MVKCNTTSWMEPWDRKRTLGFSDGSVVEDLPANTEDARDVSLIPGLERSPEIGIGNPL